MTSGNSSNPSNTINVNTLAPQDITPPTVPLNLDAQASGPTTVTLTWEPSTDFTGVTSYDILRDDVFLMSVGTVTSTIDSTVTGSHDYVYLIQARDAAGNTSARSNPAPVTTPASQDVTPPSAPSNLITTTVAATAISMTWSASADDVAVIGYDIFRNGVFLANVANAPFTDVPVSQTTTYTYVVLARDAGLNVSNPSNILTVSTPASIDITAPTTPTNVTASVLPNQSPVTVTWTASTDDFGVAGYDIFRNGLFLMSVLTQTSAGDLTARASTAYSYTVRARDAAGNASGRSTPPAFITTPGPLFADGFESGNFSAWTTTGGLVITDTTVHSGAKAAEGIAMTNTMYAKKVFPVGYTNGYARVYFNVLTNTSQTTLLGFRTLADANIGYLFLSTSGRLWYRNETGPLQLIGPATNLTGSGWHSLELHMNITGGAFSQVEVWLDGIPVGQLSRTAINLGATPIGKIQIGDVQNGHYHALFDDAAFDTRRIGP